MSKIKITGVISLRADCKLNADSVYSIVRQNIVAGTYREFTEDIKSLLDQQTIDLVDNEKPSNRLSHINDNDYLFELRVPEKYFPLDMGGDIHLLDSLIGDMFSLQVENSIERILISDVKWEGLERSLQDKKLSPIDIREKFQLENMQNLLGFSVKPRVGLSDKEFFNRCENVAQSGFHIVEPDTRKMILSDCDLKKNIEFAGKVSKLCTKHKCAYGINLSNYSGDIEKAASQLVAAVGENPAVIKLDAGLDSISKLRTIKNVSDNIIVTSYPLVRKVISKSVPVSFLDKVLSKNGIDIMYPGGFFAVPENMRHYNASTEKSDLTQSIIRYQSHLKYSRFTPTITGGVTAALLHLYYELYGPKVSMFLGGAISTNDQGYEAGAKLCIKVLSHAMQQRSRETSYKRIKLPSRKLIHQIKRETGQEYVIPHEFIEQNGLADFVDNNWEKFGKEGIE